MIKKICLLIFLLVVFCSSALAQTLVRSGNYSEGWISFEIFALDDTGAVGTPDSAIVIVYRDSSATNAVTFSSYCDDANWADSAWIDSSTYRGTKHYYFRQQILTLAGNIAQPGGYHGTLWFYEDGQGTPNKFSFQIIDSTTALSVALNNLDATISSRSVLVATDNIGINWADITNVSTAQSLSATTFSTSQVIARADSVTGVARLTFNMDSTGYQLADSAITNAKIKSATFENVKFATDYWTGNIGINWGDVSNPTTTVGLTGTTISTGQVFSFDNFTGTIGNSQLEDSILSEGKFKNLTFTYDKFPSTYWAGNIGINWGDVSNQGTTVGLTGTTVGTVTTTGTATTITNPVKVNEIKANTITDTAFVDGAITDVKVADAVKVDLNTWKTGAIVAPALANYPGVNLLGINSQTTSPANLDEAFDADTNSAGNIYRVSQVTSQTGAGATDWTTVEKQQIRLSLGVSGDTGITGLQSYAFGRVWSYGTRTLTSGAGTGANQVILTVKQSSDSTPIASAQVQILNQGQTATIGLLTTNPSGLATFALDNAIYKVRLFKPGWQFTVPESVVVSGNTSKTFYGSIFNPGSPPSPSLCRVYGWVNNLSGVGDSGMIIAARIKTAPLRYQTAIISPYEKRDTTNSQGYWYLDLYPDTLLTPSGTKYEFMMFKTVGTIRKDTAVTVPNQNCWQYQW